MSRVKDERIRALEREVELLKEIATLKEAARDREIVFVPQYIPQPIQWVPPQWLQPYPNWPAPYVGDVPGWPSITGSSGTADMSKWLIF